VIPNEVPILLYTRPDFAAAECETGLGAMGLRWPVSWRQTLLIGLAAGDGIWLGCCGGGNPLTALFWPPAVLPNGSRRSLVIRGWRCELAHRHCSGTFVALSARRSIYRAIPDDEGVADVGCGRPRSRPI